MLLFDAQVFRMQMSPRCNRSLKVQEVEVTPGPTTLRHEMRHNSRIGSHTVFKRGDAEPQEVTDQETERREPHPYVAGL